MKKSTRSYLKSCLPLFLFWLAGLAIAALLVYLYGSNPESILLYAILSGLCLLVWIAAGAHKYHQSLRELSAGNYSSALHNPACRPSLERLEDAEKEIRALQTRQEQEKDELQDYFSLWAHDIKLPLAAMKLQIESGAPSLSALSSDLGRMEKSVDGAMAFIRLDGSDYRFVRVSLEQCARQVIRDNASLLISRHLRPVVESDGSMVSSDSKWVSFVIEQLLANAVKYSQDGSSLTFRIENGALILEDEGCGIPEEDLPRIFEKGFTGRNGHSNTLASSGLGLYLCAAICRKLGCRLTVSNRTDTPGVRAEIAFSGQKHQFE